MTRQTGPIDVALDEPIEIVEPRDDWATPFAAEAAALHGALGPLVLAVEHIGSTAVPGLVAKPIIDIQVGVAGPPELARVFAPLVSLGYCPYNVDREAARRPTMSPSRDARRGSRRPHVPLRERADGTKV